MEMAIEGERLRKYVDILEEVEEFHPGGRIRSSVDALKLTSLKYLDLVRATSIPLGVPYTPTQLSDLPRDFMSMLFIDFARKYHKLVRWKLHLVFLEVLQYATDNGLLMSYQWQDRLATFENIIANHVYLYGKYKIYLLEVWERLSADEVDEYRRLLEGELRNTQTANGADKKKLMEYVTPGYMQELLQVNGLPYWFTDVLEQDIVPDVPVNYLEMATVYHQVVVYRTLNILRFLDHVVDTHGQGMDLGKVQEAQSRVQKFLNDRMELLSAYDKAALELGGSALPDRDSYFAGFAKSSTPVIEAGDRTGTRLPVGASEHPAASMHSAGQFSGSPVAVADRPGPGPGSDTFPEGGFNFGSIKGYLSRWMDNTFGTVQADHGW
ncbi:hypothetical protein SeMB42_g07718 [Synchytrium endobioticum]|uniref:Uncharacterized protein n=1 Tax=Synchytrium endobioticum TaxID=286115 RepID=A0A507BXW5_9FUNG|nr:hypothetical protein SeMB42_g07718 [Synchytrium endobioticum]